MRILALFFCCLAACGGSSRTTPARYPGAPLAFDRAGTKPDALALADKVLAAHGGAANWEKAKQVRWRQSIERDGKVVGSGQQAWDRWNARHWAELDRTDGQNTGVMYEIYGDYMAGYVLSKSGAKQPVPNTEVRAAIALARQAWQRDSTILLAPFLLHEPGSKLELVGPVKDDKTGAEYQELKLTFDPKDTARAGLVVHVYADSTTGVVGRVELEVGADRYAYTLGGYQDIGGLKLATERTNLGSGEIVKLKDLKAGGVDDELYIAPLFGPA
jgi:hypothetical protein